MKLLMKGYGLKAFEKEVNSEEEAVSIFEEMRDEYLDGCSSNEIYQVILMDDGSMKNISHNGRITPMEDYCKEWISSGCEFAEEIVKLGYKGPFKDKAKMKEDINGNEFVIQLPNKAYWGYGPATEIYDAEHYETREAAVKECKRIYDGSGAFYIVEVAEDDFGDMNRIVKKTKFNPMKENKLKEEATEVTGLKWFRDGDTYKPAFFGTGVDAKAIDEELDAIITAHNNHFEIKPDLWVEFVYWDTFNGDNVCVEYRFNRPFVKPESYINRTEPTEFEEVEDLLNKKLLKEWGFGDAEVDGVGYDSSRGVPSWGLCWYKYSDYNKDLTFKKPNSLDYSTCSRTLNGTESFTVEEGKEISKNVLDKVISMLEAHADEVYDHKGSKLVLTNTRVYDPDWRGSYTHNFGSFNFEIDLDQFYDENAVDYRGEKGDYFYSEEWRLSKVLEKYCAEALNDYLAEYALEIRPDSCNAHWYHGSSNDNDTVTYYEVHIGFKEIGIDPHESYFAHKGKSYLRHGVVEDPNPNRTFPKRPKKVAESEDANPQFVAVIKEYEDPEHITYYVNGEGELTTNYANAQSFNSYEEADEAGYAAKLPGTYHSVKRLGRVAESRVKPGNNGLEQLDQVVLNYFAEGLGDPIVENTGADPKSFTYRMKQGMLEKTYLVSLDGEYFDDVWIKLKNLDIGSQTSYVVSAGEEYYWSGMSVEELQADLEDCFANVALPNRHLHESSKGKKMRRLKENTFESYWSNGGAEALQNRFHEICSKLGVWTREDKGCENFGLYLRVGHSYNDENDLRLHIVSPKYYLTDNGADMWAKPNSTEDFDEWVTKYIKEYSWLFKEKDRPAYKHLVKSANPEPWTTFVANEGKLRKSLKDAFKSPECKYIDMDEQYDMYGEVQFEVDSVSDADDELAINMTWEERSNPDSWTVFKFDSNLNYTVTMNGETVTGQGYEDAAKQYVLRLVNKYAEGEFAKEYEPECYELRVYLRQDFYTKASKNIWQAIEGILEDNCDTYTNYEPEDWVDDRAAVWTSIEVNDLKRVLDWLKKRRSAPRIEIWDENEKNVTSKFWTPKVEESVELKEKVILHFDLEDGEHKAIPFNSREDALEYMDSDEFPIGEWVGGYEIETVGDDDDDDYCDYDDDDEDWEDEEEYGDDEDGDDEEGYDEAFYLVQDEDFHNLKQEINTEHGPIYKPIFFEDPEEAKKYAIEHPEVYYVQECFGPDLCDYYEGDFIWKKNELEESKKTLKEYNENDRVIVRACRHFGLPIIEVIVNDKCVYSADFETPGEASRAAANLRSFIRNRVGEIVDLCRMWDKSYVSYPDDVCDD